MRTAGGSHCGRRRARTRGAPHRARAAPRARAGLTRRRARVFLALSLFACARAQLEPMPNTSQRQLDYMEEKDLFAEFEGDLRAAGIPDTEIPDLGTWSRVWKAHFKLIKIRKHRQVRLH